MIGAAHLGIIAAATPRAGGGGSGWAPTDLTGLTLWLDGQDTSSMTKAGSPDRVSQWNDKSGNANHCAQATSSSRPIYVASAINGHSALESTGLLNEHLLGVVNGSAVFGNASDVSLFVVFHPSVDTVAPIGTEVGNTGYDRFVPYTNYSGQTLFDAGRFDLARLTHASGDGFWTANPQVGLFTRDGAVMRIRRNGTTLASRADAAGTAGLAEPYKVFGDGAATTCTGYIGEIVVYSPALSSTDEEMVEGYLAHKWGLAGSLPSGHPYKSSPP